MAATDEAHQIAGLLFEAVDLTRRRFDEMCAEFDMTPVQARALMALDGPRPMGELAVELRCDPSNITGLADRLERRGLVVREADPSDRRVKRLVPTAGGKAVRQRLERALLATSPFMSALAKGERRELQRLLEKVTSRARG